jgi:predicted RNA-binding Zn-ribbon protein involved in translation (DUF1610 family)
VVCGWCGLNQALDKAVWEEFLQWLHGRADLSGGGREGWHPSKKWSIGAVNPLSGKVGLESWSSKEAGEWAGAGKDLVVEAACGHPLCTGCGAALDFELETGETRVFCGQCGLQRVYRLPLQAEGKVVGLVAERHRQDLKEAVAQGGSGVVGFNCPGCGAPLEVQAGSVLVSCRFCHLSSKVPLIVDKTRKQELKPEVWWLAFTGASELRRQLEREPPQKTGVKAPEEKKGADPVGFGLNTLPWLVLPAGTLGVTGVLLYWLMIQGLLGL